MIISKDIAVLLESINTAPITATKLFNQRHRLLQGNRNDIEPEAVIKKENRKLDIRVSFCVV